MGLRKTCGLAIICRQMALMIGAFLSKLKIFSACGAIYTFSLAVHLIRLKTQQEEQEEEEEEQQQSEM